MARRPTRGRWRRRRRSNGPGRKHRPGFRPGFFLALTGIAIAAITPTLHTADGFRLASGLLARHRGWCVKQRSVLMARTLWTFWAVAMLTLAGGCATLPELEG